MKKYLILLVAILSLAAGAVRAGELREIELKDGSIITGEVVSLGNGIYTIKSNALGTLKVEENKVKVIRPITPPQIPADAQHSMGNEVTTLQHEMMSDKEVVCLIQSLQNDPEFMKLLEDPDILKAVKSNDIPALTANPKFMKLLDNQTVQEIQKKVK